MTNLLVQWLIPPVCGAAAGCVFGALVLPRVAAAAAASAASPGSGAGQRLEQSLADVLGGLLASRETIYAVRDLVTGLVGALASRPVAEVWKQIGLPDLLSERLLPALSDERRRRAIAESTGGLVAREAGQALSDEVLDEIIGVVETAMPQASDALVRWLRSPETRDELAARGRELLPKILATLSDLQKLFVTAGQFDRRLDEKMPEIVDETVRTLERMALDPRQQDRLLGVLSEAARGWRDSLLITSVSADGEERRPREKLAGAFSLLVDRFLATLEDPEQRRRGAPAGAGRRAGGRPPRGAFARDTFGVRESEVAELLSARVLERLTAAGAAQDLARRARAPLGQTLPSAARRMAGSSGARRLFGILGAGAGLCGGLLVIALRALGLG